MISKKSGEESVNAIIKINRTNKKKQSEPIYNQFTHYELCCDPVAIPEADSALLDCSTQALLPNNLEHSSKQRLLSRLEMLTPGFETDSLDHMNTL